MIKGKQALITGGAYGIGFECVKLLLKNGAKKVFIIDNDEDHISKVEEIQRQDLADDRLIIFNCDVRNLEGINTIFNLLKEKFVKLDIIIVNAAVFNDNDWENTIKTNLIGSTCCILAAINHMKENKGGEKGIIINMCSISGIYPIYGCPIYSATKSALISLGRSFSSSYFENNYGFKIMNMCPSFTYTGMSEYLMDKFISDDIREEWWKFLERSIILTPEYVAQQIIRMIQEGENGDTWLCESDSIQKIKFECIKSKL